MRLPARAEGEPVQERGRSRSSSELSGVGARLPRLLLPTESACREAFNSVVAPHMNNQNVCLLQAFSQKNHPTKK